MREILFKAKRIDNGEWVNGSYVYTFSEDKKCSVVGVMTENHWIVLENGNMVLIDKDTLCQYTGLTDRNGNIIWENDIIKGYSIGKTIDDLFPTSHEFVHWRDGALGSGWATDSYDITTKEIKFKGNTLSKNDCKLREVIGNIFDNPELLEN